MGTNFYSLHKGEHIGKRSAAGLYCWDCKITLCKDGDAGVHYDKEWHDACPKCGQKPKKEGLDTSSVGLELGFNKKTQVIKKGVSSCSSFTWAIDFDKSMILFVVDEYGKKYTRKQFLKMLDYAPIRYFNMIGKDFF